MNRKFFWIGTSILLLVVLAALVTYLIENNSPVYHGSVIDPPAPAAAFTLTDQKGQPVKLTDFHGEYVLMYFGFTNCTTECPATMAVLAKARNLLGEDGNRFQVVLIATDPPRDTPQSMETFLNRFDATFIGATGTEDQLQPVWRDYGVTVLDGGETHSNYIYLIDPNGDLRMTYSFPTTAEDLAADLRQFLRRS
jgi:protein SCO1